MAGQIGRPCLLGYIGKCSAPCVGRVSAAEHRRIVEDFCDFMAGKTDVMIKRLQRQMAEASAQLEFERAARLRDDLDASAAQWRSRRWCFADGTDADVVAFAQDDLEAAVQVFHVRGGRVRGERGWTIDKAATVDGTSGAGAGRAVRHPVLRELRGRDGAEGGGMDGAGIPREILVPELPANAGVLVEWLSAQRGSRVIAAGTAAR